MAVDMTKLVDGNALLYALKGLITGKIADLLAGKVDKVNGKGLSTNDYTTAEKTKLNGIAANANNYILPTATGTVLGGVKSGSNITNTDGTLSLTKANVTAALGYTPPEKDTTYSAFKGATASAAGGAGLVPAPAAGTQSAKYLRADGTWQTPPDTNTTYSDVTQSTHGLMTAADKKKLDAFGAASTYATTTYVGQQIAAAGHITRQIVDTLPAASAAKENVIYMVKKSSGTSGNLYDEYMLINGAMEKIGDTETKLETLSNADVEEILAQV